MSELMKSVVVIQRATTAEVAVEHPPDWSTEQVMEAAGRRTADLVAAAAMWHGKDRTTVEEARLDEELPEPEDAMFAEAKTVELVGEDLA